MTSEGLVKKTSTSILFEESKDLADLIVAEKDPNKLNDLTNLFKQNQLKKNLLRSNKLNAVLEMIDDEVMTRLADPEFMSNKDLLGYMNAAQQAIQNSYNTYEQLPTIQINNIENSVNIGADNLSRESKKVVIDKVNEILAQLQTDNNVIDVVEDEDV